jgi:hypothetical protein
MGIESFKLHQETAKITACGAGNSYCATNMKDDYDDNFKFDECDQQQSAHDYDKEFSYRFYVPKYQYKKCNPIGFTQCSNDANRIGPNTARQEAYLQGRGQVLGSRGCFASGLKFIPKDDIGAEDEEEEESKPHDMFFFPKTSRTNRSCFSYSEIDILDRLAPLPGAFEGRYEPLLGSQKALYGTTLSSSKQEGVSRSSAKYPEWSDMRGKYT